jgi:hypothetical protein
MLKTPNAKPAAGRGAKRLPVSVRLRPTRLVAQFNKQADTTDQENPATGTRTKQVGATVSRKTRRRYNDHAPQATAPLPPRAARHRIHT